MSQREWLLTLALLAAGACAVKGVSILTTSGAWLVAAVVLAGVAYLTLTGEDEKPDEADG